MRNYKNYLGYLILLIIIGVLTYENYLINSYTDNEIAIIKDIDKKKNIHSTIFYDQTIESLKKTNKTLYDSIKDYKNQVDYLVQFKYKKKYVVDTVFIDTVKTDVPIKTFEYTNNENDTLKYNLKIGSTVEPNWYLLKMSVSDEFTIMNRKIGEVNNTQIIPQNNGTVEDVTVFHKKKKNSFLKRFAIGPSVSLGYDFAKKEPEFLVGVSLTYNILNN